jgi:predicted ester cyclase
MTDQLLLPKPVQRVFSEMWNLHRPELAPELFSDDFRLVRGDGSFLTRDEFQESVGAWLEAFPDLIFTVERAIAQGDQAIVYWRGKGTHRGCFMNITPTYRRIDYTGISWFDLKLGLITAVYFQWDMVTLLLALSDGNVPLASLGPISYR